jgi:hypothetical protein
MGQIVAQTEFFSQGGTYRLAMPRRHTAQRYARRDEPAHAPRRWRIVDPAIRCPLRRAGGRVRGSDHTAPPGGRSPTPTRRPHAIGRTHYTRTRSPLAPPTPRASYISHRAAGAPRRASSSPAPLSYRLRRRRRPRPPPRSRSVRSIQPGWRARLGRGPDPGRAHLVEEVDRRCGSDLCAGSSSRALECLVNRR